MDVTSVGTNNPVAAVGGGAGPGGGGGGPFAKLVRHALAEANGLSGQANLAVERLATGQEANVHDVMLSVAKADLSFRMLLEIRNRLTDALQEVLRMQV